MPSGDFSVGTIISQVVGHLTSEARKWVQDHINQCRLKHAALYKDMLDKKISYEEYREKVLQLAVEYTPIFLELVRRIGFRDVAASELGIPLDFWLELKEADTDFASQFDRALDAGEAAFLTECLSRLNPSRLVEQYRMIVTILRMNRPERYNVKVTKTVSKEDVLKEVEKKLMVILMQALNEAGVDSDAQIRVINAFTGRLSSLNRKSR